MPQKVNSVVSSRRTGPVITFISARINEAEMLTLRYSEILLIIVVYVAMSYDACGGAP